MDETQFSLEVWQHLSELLQSSALPMSEGEVAWERDDALVVVKTFKRNQIAVDGIEFFFFNGTEEPLQATSDIFAEHRFDGEPWEAFVSRSCSNAETFIRETYEREGERYKGKPVFNIWASTSD